MIIIKTIKSLLKSKTGIAKMILYILFIAFLDINITDLIVLDSLMNYRLVLFSIIVLSIVLVLIVNRLLYYNNFKYRSQIENYYNEVK